MAVLVVHIPEHKRTICMGRTLHFPVIGVFAQDTWARRCQKKMAALFRMVGQSLNLCQLVPVQFELVLNRCIWTARATIQYYISRSTPRTCSQRLIVTCSSKSTEQYLCRSISQKERRVTSCCRCKARAVGDNAIMPQYLGEYAQCPAMLLNQDLDVFASLP